MELFCSACGLRYGAREPIWRCRCGEPLDLDFSPAIDKGMLDSCTSGLQALLVRAAHWIIPMGMVSLGEGDTPMLEAEIGGMEVLLKLEFLSPSGSFKDRGAAVMISRVREMGIDRVVEDSSGNAGAAVAAYCAAAGIGCEIYVPEETSAGKTAQIEAMGAALVRVPGDREDTAAAVRTRAEEVYYASHCWNPWFLHGTKTFAYEVWSQLGGRAPEAVVFPVGHGSLLLGTWLGFGELLTAGLVERLPRLIAVQAAACAPLLELWRGEGGACSPEAETAAEGIRVRQPVRGKQIIAAVRESGGEVVAVGEDEIRRALRGLLDKGLFVEPTAAVAVAGLEHLGRIPGGVVVPLTGSGLKSPAKVLSLLRRNAERSKDWITPVRILSVLKLPCNPP